ATRRTCKHIGQLVDEVCIGGPPAARLHELLASVLLRLCCAVIHASSCGKKRAPGKPLVRKLICGREARTPLQKPPRYADSHRCFAFCRWQGWKIVGRDWSTCGGHKPAEISAAL